MPGLSCPNIAEAAPAGQGGWPPETNARPAPETQRTSMPRVRQMSSPMLATRTRVTNPNKV